MLNAVRASFYKMFHDKAFWICIDGTIFWVVIVILAQLLTRSARGITDVSVLANRWYGFIGLHSVEVPLIIGAAILFSSDFKDKSWKLLIAKGISKTSYYFSKLISMTVLTVIICFVSIFATAVGNVVLLHATMDLDYVLNVFVFFMGETIAHLSISVLTLMVICIVKRSEIASMICLTLMVLGYVIMHGIENALSLGEVITDHWAFSMTAYVEFAGETDWERILLSLLVYYVGCSLITIAFLNHKDIE